MDRIGQYAVEAELGRGGMGVVYRVSHPELQHARALKLMFETEENAQRLARFGREAEAMAKVQHPNVVTVHELGRCPRGPYLVSELVEGDELGELIKRGPVDPQVAASAVRDLAAGAHALHQAGIIHRDLKPSNAILTPEGRAVLLDLGLAHDQSAERLTRTGELTGTPAFMSPEQATGDRAAHGPHTDVYGLGAVLYALLTGRPPFEGDLLSVLRRIVLDPPEWPQELRAPVPAGLIAVCEQALSKAPEDRYPTALALQEDLERVLAGEAPLARRPRQQSRAGWVLAGALALVALLLGAVVAVSQRSGGGGEAPSDPVLSEEQRAARRLEQALDELQREAPDAFAAALDGALAETWPTAAQTELRLLARARRSLQRLHIEGAEPWLQPGSARAALAELEAWRAEHGERFAVLDTTRARPLAWRLGLQVALEAGGEGLLERHGGAVPRMIGLPQDRLALCGSAGLSSSVDLRLVGGESVPIQRRLAVDQGSARPRAVGYHRSGALLAAGAGDVLYLLDPSGDAPLTRYPLVPRPDAVVSALDCSPGAVAVGYSDGRLAVYAWPLAAPPRELAGLERPISDLAFVGGAGEFLAVCDRQGLSVWHVASGTVRWSFEGYGGAGRLAAAGAGSTRFGVTFPNRHAMALFEPDAADPVITLVAPDEAVDAEAARGVAISANGALLFSLSAASLGDEGRSLRVWDVASGALLAALYEPQLAAGGSTIALTPEGTLAITFLDVTKSRLRIWRLGDVLRARPLGE